MFNPNEHMMKLKGKDYLQVMWRLVWFREDKPLWSIDTEIKEADNEHAIFRATICDENGIVKSCGHGSESKRDFGDFLEKAETKAVGRALAMLGYGTQFAADELDEGERIVDGPVQRKADKPVQKINEEPEEVEIKAPTCCRCQSVITGVALPDGSTMTAADIVGKSKLTYGGVYCWKCMKELKEARRRKAV